MLYIVDEYTIMKYIHFIYIIAIVILVSFLFTVSLYILIGRIRDKTLRERFMILVERIIYYIILIGATFITLLHFIYYIRSLHII